MDTLRVAARSALIDVLSARENRTNSGIVARLAGDAIGADGFLPTMGTDEFLSCLSRQALECSCKDTSVLPRARVKDTRAALVEHFGETRFVHPLALFAPATAEVATWRSKIAVVADEDEDSTADAADSESGDADALADVDLDAIDEAYRVAAE
ncbi:Plasmid partitioning protein (fragment) [Bosea sp. 125]